MSFSDHGVGVQRVSTQILFQHASKTKSNSHTTYLCADGYDHNNTERRANVSTGGGGNMSNNVNKCYLLGYNFAAGRLPSLAGCNFINIPRALRMKTFCSTVEDDVINIK